MAADPIQNGAEGGLPDPASLRATFQAGQDAYDAGPFPNGEWSLDAREEAGWLALFEAGRAAALRTVPSGKERELGIQMLNDDALNAGVPSGKEREGWRPISECPRDACKIIGGCLFGRNYEEGEARFCSRYPSQESSDG